MVLVAKWEWEDTREVQFQNTTTLMLLSKNKVMAEHLQMFVPPFLLLLVVVVEGGRGGGYKEGTMSARVNVALADFCKALTRWHHQPLSLS